MRLLAAIAVLMCGAVYAELSELVSEVRSQAMTGDLASARRDLKAFRAAKGVTPEYLEALSWVGRGEMLARNYKAAEDNATEVRKLALDLLAKRALDDEPRLPMALSASIEVQSQAAAVQGRRDEAVVFLSAELTRWRDTSMRARIGKNLNLLTLEGKPAPPLVVARGLTETVPRSLARHAGHPVLLFFWAHWCADCKQQIAVVQLLQKTFGPRGLLVIAPTRHYGYVAGGRDASPEKETAYMREVFRQYYAPLGAVEVPISEENFAAYGVSTTPTLVLLDPQGVVRLYNPGTMPFDQLSARIAAVIAKT